MSPKAAPSVAHTAPALQLHQTAAMSKAVADVRSDVEVGFTINSVSAIDPVEGTFHADLRVFVRWHDGAMESDPDMVAMHARGEMANGTPFAKE